MHARTRLCAYKRYATWRTRLGAPPQVAAQNHSVIRARTCCDRFVKQRWDDIDDKQPRARRFASSCSHATLLCLPWISETQVPCAGLRLGHVAEQPRPALAPPPQKRRCELFPEARQQMPEASKAKPPKTPTPLKPYNSEATTSSVDTGLEQAIVLLWISLEAPRAGFGWRFLCVYVRLQPQVRREPERLR